VSCLLIRRSCPNDAISLRERLFVKFQLKPRESERPIEKDSLFDRRAIQEICEDSIFISLVRTRPPVPGRSLLIDSLGESANDDGAYELAFSAGHPDEGNHDGVRRRPASTLRARRSLDKSEKGEKKKKN